MVYYLHPATLLEAAFQLSSPLMANRAKACRKQSAWDRNFILPKPIAVTTSLPCRPMKLGRLAVFTALGRLLEVGVHIAAPGLRA